MKPPLWKHQLKELQEHALDTARGLLWSMRSGKTRVIIESFDELKDQGLATGLLIIAPNGVHTQWVEREIPRWSYSQLNGLAWHSATTDANAVNIKELDVLALNVDALKVERAQGLVKKFLIEHGSGETVMVVFDESHEFRRPGTRKTRLARGLAKRCKYKRILTGTVALNSPLHVWSQFELLAPCALGHRTFGAFKSYYAEWAQIQRRDGRSFPKVVGYRHLEELQSWVSLWASVVPRSQADVPAVLKTERIAPLSVKQEKAYAALKLNALTGIDELSAVEITAHLIKFQQILGGFILNDHREVINIDFNPPRLIALVEEVLGTEPCKAIVWCHSTMILNHLNPCFPESYRTTSNIFPEATPHNCFTWLRT